MTDYLGSAFLEFWSMYPRRVAKFAAHKAFMRALTVASPAQIFEGVARYLDHIKAERTELHYVAHPSTWLNQGRWADEYEMNMNGRNEAARFVKAALPDALAYWRGKGSSRIVASLEKGHVDDWMLVIPESNVVSIRKEAGQQ